MPAIGSLPEATQAISLYDPTSIVLTLASVVCMITVLSMCTCCQRKVKNRDPDDVYGVVNPAAVTVTSGEGPSTHSVHFRTQSKQGTITERHSQPAGKSSSTVYNASRVSAPGRALPQLPADLYTAIDKTRKDDIRFVDEGVNPTYESIDPDVDSIIDPLYSKVGDPRVTKRERRYDYPIFSGRKQDSTAAVAQQPDEVLYQSASQIYAAGSEDPYSSITSDSRIQPNSGDGDSSSAYDPGYAKVNQTTMETKRLDRIEKTERELDQLYSKIRRQSSTERNSSTSPPGPSRVLMDDVIRDDPLINVPPAQIDAQSIASREPSYRYITVRESADVVRERLRQQGGLGPPVREHYYSTIGNEYETVGDGSSSTYSQLNPSNNDNNILIPTVETTSTTTGTTPVTSFGDLSVSINPREFVPPPPTSPIPDRNAIRNNQDYLTSTANDGLLSTSNANTSRMTSPAPSSVTVIQQFRSPDMLERTDPINGATYTVVSKSHKHNPVMSTGKHITTTFGATPERVTTSESSEPHANFANWNAPSLSTATSFAGLQRPLAANSLGAPGSERRSTSPLATVQGIQEFMQRPVLPYNIGDTIVGRKVTEERETIVENRCNTSMSATAENNLPNGAQDTANALSRSYDSSAHLFTRDGSQERVHHVEIKRVEGPSANFIISGRRYRSASQNSVNGDIPMSARGPLNPLNFSSETSMPGPSTPYSTVETIGLQKQSTLIDDEDATAAAYLPSTAGSNSARSRSSARSGLPLPMNGEEVKRLADRSRQRRQESIEREEAEKRAQLQQQQQPNSARSLDRKKTWKVESEEEKIQRLGTIYTANDYVSTIDMGTARPWPMLGSSSPPSLRKEFSNSGLTQDEEDNNNVKSAREQLFPTESVTFSWDLSESSSLCEDQLLQEKSAMVGAEECEDPLCFCHGGSSRSTVKRGNKHEMKKLNWGNPIDD